MGTDEESGSSDIAYYYAREPYAPYAFSPTRSSPHQHREGQLQAGVHQVLARGDRHPRVTEFRGGFRINVLPPEAECLVAGLSADAARPYCDRAAAETGVRYELREEGTACTSSAAAKAHASPAGGGRQRHHRPAPSALLPSPGQGGLHRRPPRAQRPLPHGDCAGKALGIAQSDELSGALTLAFSPADRQRYWPGGPV